MVRRHPLFLIAAFIAGASLLGLGTPMAMGGTDVLGMVWGASPIGTLVFVVGMGIVGFGAFQLSRSRLWWLALLVGALGAWVVYALSWSFTGPAIDPQDSDFAPDEAWTMTATWGWPGLLFSAVAPPLYAHLSGLVSSRRVTLWDVAQREEPKRHA